MYPNSRGRGSREIAVLVRYAALAASDASADDCSAEALKTGIKQCRQMSFPPQKELSSGKAFLLPWIRLPRGSTAFVPTEAQTDAV